MANILTAAEAAVVLRCEATDANMLALLSQVDAYIKNATGHDWASDTSIRAEAKSAARMLLVRWHEDPGGMAAQSALGFGLSQALVQLECLALNYSKVAGRNGAGPCALLTARAGDAVSSVTGLVGTTGSQVASFETVITVDGQIQQVATSDLSDNWYKVYLTPLSESL